MKRRFDLLLFFLIALAGNWASEAKGDWLEIDANRTAGAQGDSSASGGGTDDTAVIQQFLSAASVGDTVVLGATKSGRYYRVTDRINVPVGVNFLCYGTIVYDSSDNEEAVRFGGAGANNQYVRARLSVIRLAQSDWSNEADVGVVFYNPVQCEIDIPLVKGFTIGVQYRSHIAAGYNKKVNIDHFLDCKIGLDLHSFTAGGYVNENTFHGGRYTYTTGVNTTQSRYGIRFASEPGAYTGHNNNVFYSPTFELGSSQANPGEAIPVLITNNALYNCFYGYRTEGNSEPHVKVTGAEAAYNEYYPARTNGGTTQAPTEFISWQGNRKADIVRTPEGLLYQTQSEWHSGNIPQNTTQRTVGGFEKTHTRHIHWEVSAGGGSTSLVQSLHLTNDGDFVTPTGSSPAPGIVIDSTKNKRFVARKRVNAAVNGGGRFAVRCYDGHPLDGGLVIGSASPLLVRGGQAGFDPAWSGSAYGGVFVRGADSDSDWFFTVDDSVKYFVLLCSNSAIASFSVGTIDPFPINAFPLHGVDTGLRYMDDVPDTGSYKDGTIVFNSNQQAAISVPTHWTCTVDGTTFTPSYRGQLTLVSTTTWDVDNLASGDSDSQTITVTGAVPGNVCVPALSTALPDKFTISANVSAADTVKVTVSNVGGATTDLPSATLRVQLFQ